jgi:hypothetical protein
MAITAAVASEPKPSIDHAHPEERILARDHRKYGDPLEAYHRFAEAFGLDR